MTLEREKVRCRALSSALALMDEGGLEAVQARAITKDVGVSVGTLYNIFGSLDELLEELCAGVLSEFSNFSAKMAANPDRTLKRQIQTSVDDDLARQYSGYRELLERFLMLANVYISFVERFERRWIAVLAFNRDREEDAAAGWYVEQQDVLFDLIGDILNRTSLGQDPQIRRTAARALWSGVHGIVTMGYIGQITPKTRENIWNQIVLLVSYFVIGLLTRESD